ncbi:unnamed protein product [Nippostrongylus brasiliensis]|uniref:Multiple epidermal growth factor-like domains protein 11 n=1 Tax=Nippostrongylus brasiliensis TaxID=27835 RepID=A0A0N4YJJ3_NIPBR|nr:unnamed protein product [Nippostrongylus brasiliensis]
MKSRQADQRVRTLKLLKNQNFFYQRSIIPRLVCPEGRWGPGCKDKCRCANGAHCNPATGECKCNLGYTGTICDQSCPSGKYGLNCTLDCECHGNARCDPVQGCCDCPPGRYGTRCQFVCPPGFYGWYCSQSCSCQNGASCDPGDGQCLCPPGRESIRRNVQNILLQCESSCKNSTYGPHCQLKCDCGDYPCDPRDGTCQCPVGLSGPKCQQGPNIFHFSMCRQGRYGENCVHKCQCYNGATCDRKTGKCTCAPGYLGPTCQHELKDPNSVAKRGDLPEDWEWRTRR